MFPISIPSRFFVATLAITLSAGHPLIAQEYQWKGGSGNWNDPANWNPATSPGGPSGVGVSASLEGGLSENSSVVLNAATTVGHLNISGGSYRYALGADTGSSLIFDNGSNKATLTQRATSSGDTIAAPIILNSSLDVWNLSSEVLTLSGDMSSGGTGKKIIEVKDGSLKLSGVISGSIGVVQSGTGTLFLSGVNGFNGGITLNSGTLSLDGSRSLGAPSSANLITINGGTLHNVQGSALTAGYSFLWNGDFHLDGTGRNFNTSKIALGNDVSVTSVAGNTYTFGGVISDGGKGYGITFSGDSTFALNATNTLSGTLKGRDGASIQLSGAGGLQNISQVDLSNSRLYFSNSSTVISDRLASNATVRLDASTFEILTAKDVNVSQKLAKLTLAGGTNLIYLRHTGTGRSILELDTLQREGRAIGVVRGVSQDSEPSVLIREQPLLVGGDGASKNTAIIPYLIGEWNINNSNPGGSLLTADYDPITESYSLRALTADDYHSFTGSSAALPPTADLAALAPDTNVRINATLLNAPVQIKGGKVNSLQLHQQSPTGALNNEARFTIGDGEVEIGSGVLLFSRTAGVVYSTVLEGGGLQFGNREGVITATTGGEVVISSKISGQDGITLSTFNAGSAITLASNENDYRGRTTINGTVNIGIDGAIPSASEVHVATNGQLNAKGHNITAGSLSGNGRIQLSDTAGGSLTLGEDDRDSTFAGKIGGVGGSVTKKGSGAQTFSGYQTYSGATTVQGGSLIIQGEHTGAGDYLVEANGTLGGNGRIAFASGKVLQVAGTLEGGLVLELTAGSGISFQPEGRLSFTLGEQFTSDFISVNSLLSDGITFTGNSIDFVLEGPLELGCYTLFSANDSLIYNGLTLDGNGTIIGGLQIGSGLEMYEAYMELIENDLRLHVTAAIPEPSTWASMGAVLGVFAFTRAWRCRKNII